MNLFPSSKTAQNIVNELKKGPIMSRLLIEKLTKSEKKITPQAVYKSLRGLRKQGIVLLQNKEAVLNQKWLQDLEDFALVTEHAYRNPSLGSGHFLHMQDGDRITYEFKNPVQVDIFWNHVLYILFDVLPNIDALFAYASHFWFLLGRRQDELALRDWLKAKGIRYLITSGNRTSLDRFVAKDFDGNNSQYYMREKPLFDKRSNNLGIVLSIAGDYLIEGQYDKKLTKSIEEFYNTTKEFNLEKQKELELIISKTAKIKFVISRNSKKAARLRKGLEKYFYLPKK